MDVGLATWEGIPDFGLRKPPGKFALLRTDRPVSAFCARAPGENEGHPALIDGIGAGGGAVRNSARGLKRARAFVIWGRYCAQGLQPN